MAIVRTISKKAERALLVHGVTFEYGYGDVYHFSSGVPGETSAEIKSAFAFDQTRFVVIGSRLQLEEEGQAKE